jgi:hypothetical protein
MSGMEFTWRLIAVLAWPVVILCILVAYRGWITSTITSVTAGKRLEEAAIGPLRFKWASEINTAGREVASALTRIPKPPSEGPVSTSLVDLIDDVNTSPRHGIRKAFILVRQALNEFYPGVHSRVWARDVRRLRAPVARVCRRGRRGWRRWRGCRVLVR